MINDIIYLDNAATTKPFEDVINSMIPYLRNNFGNPSSIYSLGTKSKVAIEKSRMILAKNMSCKPSEVFFTSSGTEADNWALKGIAESYKTKGKHIITSKIEHPAVLNTCKFLERQGYEVTYLDVDSEGIVNIEELQSSIKKETILISIMYANNEVGTIQPIEEIGKIAKENGVIFHTDAVQAYGLLDIDINKNNIDLMTISGHKINGPKGIGVLYIRDGINIENLIHGGLQERGKRASTENVANIVGLAKAIELTNTDKDIKITKLKSKRDYFIDRLKDNIPNLRLNGDSLNRLPNNINVSFGNLNSESILMSLDINGIAASAGSACTSGTIEPSHVLKAMKLNEEDSKSAIRFSIGIENTKEELDFVVDTLIDINKRVK
ncbi:cysteine desulfurase family protein [Miniphocaeibacter massiliensis]|uniref:cysteine desulfurase family protein n=1 Tax=Miniphocaeibacter massiliensis TaxID=2041841 RepID=UPI001A91FAFA|nr:cysteine desulfurase family protein [Miniphocaeibacter massiliensis]